MHREILKQTELYETLIKEYNSYKISAESQIKNLSAQLSENIEKNRTKEKEFKISTLESENQEYKKKLYEMGVQLDMLKQTQGTISFLSNDFGSVDVNKEKYKKEAIKSKKGLKNNIPPVIIHSARNYGIFIYIFNFNNRNFKK